MSHHTYLSCRFIVPGAIVQRIAGAPAKVRAGIADLIEKGIAVEWDIDVRVSNAFLGVSYRGDARPRPSPPPKRPLKRWIAHPVVSSALKAPLGLDASFSFMAAPVNPALCRRPMVRLIVYLLMTSRSSVCLPSSCADVDFCSSQKSKRWRLSRSLRLVTCPASATKGIRSIPLSVTPTWLPLFVVDRTAVCSLTTEADTMYMQSCRVHGSVAPQLHH